MQASRFVSRIALAILFCAGGILLAQSDKGAIAGSVTDGSGAIVPNVTITAVNTATALQRKTESTEAGRFTLPELPAGTYAVTASFPGFKTLTQTGVTVEVSKTVTLAIILQVGQTADSVEVKADASMLNVENADVATTVKNTFITQLPMDFSNNIRSPYGFLKLVPGAAVGKDGSWPMTSQNGLQSFTEEIRVDGGSTANPVPGVISETQVGVDAVEEFTVQTNTYSAEYGSAAGSIMNFSLKSGTNQLHGSGYGFMRNEFFNAANKDTGDNPRQRRADYGGTFGGPVYIPKVYNGKDKTFFFATFEDYWQRQRSQGFFSVPRAEWRTGNLSSLLLPQVVGQDALGRDVRSGQIYDPNSLRWVDVNGVRTPVRDPFVGNVIPSNMISPVAQKILGYVPQASIPGTDTNNLIGANGDPLKDIRIWTAKLDHNFSDRNHLSGSINRENVHKLNSTDPFGTASGERDQRINSVIARINDDHTISPTMLNHLTLGVMRYVNPDGGTQYPGFDQASDLGLKGSPVGSYFPWISYGLTDLGAKQGKIMRSMTLTATDTFTWIKGAHSLKFGGEYRKAFVNIFDGSSGPSWGHLNFANGDTGQPSLYYQGSDKYNLTGSAFASFLLGWVNSESLATPVALGYRYSDTALFVQDDYKVTSRLTLNLGLRWDIHNPLKEKYGRISSFEPSLANPAAGNILGAVGYQTGPNPYQPDRSLRNTFYGNVGPRFGFAYQANAKTVLRGGFGLTYGRLECNCFGALQNIGAASSSFIAAPRDGAVAPVTTLANGILPANGALYDPSVANNGGISYFNPEQNLPRIYNWNITIQREFGPNTSISAGWVATHGTRLISPAQQFNQSDFAVLAMGSKLASFISNAADAVALGVKYPYPGFQGTVAQALRPYPQFGGIDGTQATVGTSDYNSLQVQVKQRVTHGFDALISYTLSKALTDVDDAVAWGGGGTSGVDTHNLKLNRGLQVDTFGLGRGDRTHQLSAALSYELPFKQMVKGKALKYAVGGWKLNGILQYQSGEALAMSYPNPIGGYVFNNNGRMNLVNGQSMTSACSNDWPGACSKLNPAAFGSAAAFTLGSAARTFGVVRGHPWMQEDLAVARAFEFTERTQLQFRMEAINAFNRSVFANPDTNPLDPIKVDGGRLVGYGTFWGRINTQRQLQMSMKFVF